MKSDKLREELCAIAQRYDLFECVPCAAALRAFLISQGIIGRQISLSTGSTEDPFCNIYHEGLQCNISINGRHEAIAVILDGQEVVFDNICPVGIIRETWLASFYCPIQDLGGEIQVAESEF